MLKVFESWCLFWLIALAISAVTCLGLPQVDFHSARGTAPIIVQSVCYALPLFLLAFTASSLARLWPSPASRWLVRNRRYIGLSFSFGMTWHFSFVSYSIFSFGLDASGLTMSGLVLDLVAFIFLLLMTLTSFKWSSRHLTAANWRRLHKAGVYAIWFVATHIYLSGLRHAPDAEHVVASSLLVAAWLLRVIAWLKSGSRQQGMKSA
jgi:sulfoxide reductase heme-binding subunit YedZ